MTLRFRIYITLILVLTLNEMMAQSEVHLLKTSASPSERKKAARKLLGNDLGFDSLYSLLKEVANYPEIGTGLLEWNYKVSGVKYFSLIRIPDDYNPEKAHPVVFILHGGVFMSDQQSARKWWENDRLDYPDGSIIVYPSSWPESPWWQQSQYENIDYLVKRIKSSFNVDHNRFHLMGISDGGTGLYYLANISPTVWASYVPMIANPGGLRTLADKQIYARNFEGKPFLAINTEEDHLFPPEAVRPYMQLLQSVNVQLDYRSLEGEGHSLNWYPLYRQTILDFQETNKRTPFPDTLFWETEHTQTLNRNHWIEINKLTENETEGLEDVNRIPVVNYLAFPRDTLSGRLRVIKRKNEVDIQSNGVKRMTLFISPDHFDMSQPIKVSVNNEVYFEGVVVKDRAVLLRHFLEDLDDSMLFGGEISITLGRR